MYIGSQHMNKTEQTTQASLLLQYMSQDLFQVPQTIIVRAHNITQRNLAIHSVEFQ